MKTKEELNTLKEETEQLNKKPGDLTENELQQVAGSGGGLNTNEGYCLCTAEEDV